MKHIMKVIISLAALAFLTTTSVQAGTEEKVVIALKTDDFALVEADVSDLAVGESKTIETDNGKVIDIIRTADGAEVYIDGELLEMDFSNEGLHEEHMIRKHVEVICDDDQECDKNVFFIKGDDGDLNTWISGDGDHVLLHEEIELSCSSDGDETTCSDEMVIITDGEDFDLEELHEMHANDTDHKVIMIKKHVITED
jgi:hypothetical protein